MKAKSDLTMAWSGVTIAVALGAAAMHADVPRKIGAAVTQAQDNVSRGVNSALGQMFEHARPQYPGPHQD